MVETPTPDWRAMVAEMVDDDPCDYDHNGLCQTHYHDRPCVNERARVALEADR